MANSILEEIRQNHEDLEVLEKAASQLFLEKFQKCGSKHSTVRTPLQQQRTVMYDHAIRRSVLKMQECSARLLELYQDGDGLRKEEIAYLGGGKTASNPTDGDIWSRFYERLKDIRDHHKRLGSLHVLPMAPLAELTDPPAFFAKQMQASLQDDNRDAPDDVAMKADYDQKVKNGLTDVQLWDAGTLAQIFTGGEDQGRLIDFSDLFQQYTNLPKLRRFRESRWRANKINSICRQHAAKHKTTVEEARKSIKWNSNEMEKQLEFVEIDLVGFMRIFDHFHEIPRYCKYNSTDYKTYLKNLVKYLCDFFLRQNPLSDITRIESQFSSDFQARWDNDLIPEWRTKTSQEPLYILATDMLFVTESTCRAHMDSKKYTKAIAVLSAENPQQHEQRVAKSRTEDRSIAEMESRVQRYKELLGDTIQRTIDYLYKKQSRTAEEMEEDAIAAEEAAEEQDKGVTMTAEEVEEEFLGDDDEGPVYNPKNLPLGWDGKPIPYWLYKLHGLGQEFKCEICGNYSYWGRRAFERHFSEWRHAFGMRCLRIPNTAHFKEITKIEDALALYERLKHTAELQTFNPDHDVECEDAEGNVLNLEEYMQLHNKSREQLQHHHL